LLDTRGGVWEVRKFTDKQAVPLQLLEAVRKHKPTCSSASGIDYKLLAAELTEVGYDVSIKAPEPLVNGKNNKSRCLEVLDHTYLVCKVGHGSAAETELVVEPRLREQFEIAHPTKAYARLLQALPAEYVGSRTKLKVVVEAVSAAMAEAFKAQDLSLPPWRRAAAALSKWELAPAAGGRSPSKSPEGPHMQKPGQEAGGRGAQPSGRQTRGFPENAAPKETSHFWKLPAAEAPAKGTAARKPRVSLLARDLADMAALQPGKRPLEGGSQATNIKRAPSWDFSGLPPITTVKCAGKAG
jgi:uncharacterized protein (TIGR01615 family)